MRKFCLFIFLLKFLMGSQSLAQEKSPFEKLKQQMRDLGYKSSEQLAVYGPNEFVDEYGDLLDDKDPLQFFSNAAKVSDYIDSRSSENLLKEHTDFWKKAARTFKFAVALDRKADPTNYANNPQFMERLKKLIAPGAAKDFPKIITPATMIKIFNSMPFSMTPEQKFAAIELVSIASNGSSDAKSSTDPDIVKLAEHPYIKKHLSDIEIVGLKSLNNKTEAFYDLLGSFDLKFEIVARRFSAYSAFCEVCGAEGKALAFPLFFVSQTNGPRLNASDFAVRSSSDCPLAMKRLFTKIYGSSVIGNAAYRLYIETNLLIRPGKKWTPVDLVRINENLIGLQKTTLQRDLRPTLLMKSVTETAVSGWYWDNANVLNLGSTLAKKAFHHEIAHVWDDSVGRFSNSEEWLRLSQWEDFRFVGSENEEPVLLPQLENFVWNYGKHSPSEDMAVVVELRTQEGNSAKACALANRGIICMDRETLFSRGQRFLGYCGRLLRAAILRH